MAIDEAASEPLSPDRPRVELREISGHTTLVQLIGEHDLLMKERLTDQLERARFTATVIVDLTGCAFPGCAFPIRRSSASFSAPGMVLRPRRIELVLPPAASISHRALHRAGVPAFFVSYATLEHALSAAAI